MACFRFCRHPIWVLGKVFEMWLQNLATLTQPEWTWEDTFIIPASTSKVEIYGHQCIFIGIDVHWYTHYGHGIPKNGVGPAPEQWPYFYFIYFPHIPTIPHWWGLNSHCHENSYIYNIYNIYIYIISLSLQFHQFHLTILTQTSAFRMWTCQVASARRSIWRRPLCPVPWIRWPSPIWPSQWLWKAGCEWRWHE